MENQPVLDAPKWSVLEKISFRFFFLYFSLFIIFQNNGAYPFFGYVTKLWGNLFNNYIPWIGKHILGIEYDFSGASTGSGDTTFDYVILFCISVLAVFGTIIWSVIHRKANDYRKLYYYLTVAVRFYAGLMLINYGLYKVIQLQFPQPTLYRLTETYGDSSPMGLAWTFLGFSKGYNMFMGIAEIAAVLLLFRRTLTLGLIITLMTTANVMAVNYFFDVPVKLLSTHLVLMCLFLLARDFKKLLTFFFRRVPVALSDIYKPKFHKSLSTAFTIVKVLVIGYALGYGFYVTLEQKEQYYGKETRSPLHGLYEVEEVTLNGDTKIYDDFTTKDWKYIMIERTDYAMVQFFSLKRRWLNLEVDEENKKVKLIDRRNEDKTYDLSYFEGDEDSFYLTGTINEKDTLSLTLTRNVEFQKKFLLTNRGYHWVSEVPFNR